jgi:peptide-methionine (S)-S-oxide reductase
MPTVQYSKAIFAGGCFWCMEKPFDELPGVIATTSGYTGGTKTSPTYREVSSGNTGHAEAVEVSYDPKQVKYEHLLSVFWKNIDPLDSKGQFCDKGSQYRSAIFYTDDQQKALAESSKEQVASSKNFTSIATEVTAATTFYPAEDYHQNYYQTNSVKYKFYRYSCGRDRRLEEVWGSGAAK